MGKKIYIILVTALFAAFVIVFNTFPRSTVSEVEKRELAKFPEFSFQNLRSGAFTKELSAWFSDSEPFRDHFINLSMNIKDWMRMNFSKENAITFHAPDAAPIDTEAPDINASELQNDSIPAKTKDTVGGLVGFIRENQDGLMQGVELIRGLMGKGAKASETIAESLPPINE